VRVDLVDVVEMNSQQEGVVFGEAASQRKGELVDLGPHPTLRQLGEDRGSRSRAMSASIIDRADLVSTDDATADSLIPVS